MIIYVYIYAFFLSVHTFLFKPSKSEWCLTVRPKIKFQKKYFFVCFRPSKRNQTKTVEHQRSEHSRNEHMGCDISYHLFKKKMSQIDQKYIFIAVTAVTDQKPNINNNIQIKIIGF